MLIRVVRRLTLEEVRNQIKSLEKEQSMTFDEFEELFLEKKVDGGLVDTYFYQDLQMLAKLGFVTFKKKGKRNIIPQTLLEEITLLIR